MKLRLIISYECLALFLASSYNLIQPVSLNLFSLTAFNLSFILCVLLRAFLTGWLPGWLPPVSICLPHSFPSSLSEQWNTKRPKVLLIPYIAQDNSTPEVVQHNHVRMLGLET